MNILLLGNGFDLYHKLPTRYDNFLHVVDFLNKYYTPVMKTIADIFCDSRLQKEDAFISKCYNAHKAVYETITIDGSAVEQLCNLSKDNLWLQYLLKVYDKKAGWIDFEKEIAYVLNTFDIFLKQIDVAIKFHKLTPSQQYIIKSFDFFSKYFESGIINGPTRKVIDEYILEYPAGSSVKIVNKEKIIQKLYEELNRFAKLLKTYLLMFVEASLLDIKENSLNRCPALSYIDKAITFNYTNSYETFYFSNPIFHIHGTVDKTIILGINPDNSDSLEKIDTSFVKFKKYFQRAQYDTDRDYIDWIQALNEPSETISLLVMGHSLDTTDKDIIVELFRKMNEICILYHNDEAKSTYISNLIKMFGKEEFERFRKKQKLTFLSLDMDFTSFIEKRKENANGAFLRKILPAIIS